MEHMWTVEFARSRYLVPPLVISICPNPQVPNRITPHWFNNSLRGPSAVPRSVTVSAFELVGRRRFLTVRPRMLRISQVALVDLAVRTMHHQFNQIIIHLVNLVGQRIQSWTEYRVRKQVPLYVTRLVVSVTRYLTRRHAVRATADVSQG